MTKKAVNFRFSNEKIDYVKSQLPGSGMNMTEYLEMLIDTDIDSKESVSRMNWNYGVVITSDRLIVITKPYLEAFWEFVEAGVGIITAIPNEVISVQDVVTIAIEDENVGENDIVSNGANVSVVFVDGEYICKEIKALTGKISLPKAWV